MRSKFKSTLVVCVAVIAFAAVGAAGASAATGGPEWFVKGATLATGKTQAVKLSGVGASKFLQPSAVWECTAESSTGELTGGNPGTGAETITLTGCHLEGHVECTLSTPTSTEHKSVAGEITFAVKTVLVYPQGNRGEALEAIVPVGSKTEPNVFTKLSISGGEEACGTLNGKSGVFKAAGTEVKEPAFDKKCGLLAKVGQIKAGAFAGLTSEAQTTEGAIDAPSTLITKGEIYSPASKAFSTVTCEPELTIVLGGGVVPFSTLLKVQTSPAAELFGWEA